MSDSAKRHAPYQLLLTCNPLADKVISTNRALGVRCGSEERIWRMCAAASGSLAIIVRKLYRRDCPSGSSLLKIWEWNRYYRFLLVRQNPEWWEFITNPENYKIQNIFFSNQYYKDFAQKSWDNLVWPNWAYYSWEYDENLNRNWYWEMHYFWTETANNFKIDWTDIILEFDESISLYEI